MQQRIVLLGASNLTLAFRRVTDLATASLEPGPLRFLAAAGLGRAYAMPSLVLARRLPPIAGCGLWRALAARPELPTRALVADVGNDLGFGAGVEETLDALAACLDRLRAVGAETIVVPPPVAGIERLPPRRFAVLKSILFPGRAIDQTVIVRRLRRLTGELHGLAAETGARIAEPDLRWFGFDGIHIRRSRRAEAWRSLLAAWQPTPRPETPEPETPERRLRWSWLRAEQASLAALPLHRSQPCRRLSDGSTLACY